MAFNHLRIVIIFVILIVVTATIIVGISSWMSLSSRPNTDNNSGINTSIKTTASNNQAGNVHAVQVGGGNAALSYNVFTPNSLTINVGESVTFYAPNDSSFEVHNVIFDLTNHTAISNSYVPFILPPGIESMQDFRLAPPNNVGAPIIQNLSDDKQAIVALNKIVYHPSVIYANGSTRYLLEGQTASNTGNPQSQSISYTFNGTERIVSLGIIIDTSTLKPLQNRSSSSTSHPLLPNRNDTNSNNTANTSITTDIGNRTTNKTTAATRPEQQDGKAQFLFPLVKTFTIKFDKSGTYYYVCAFHPNMIGRIIVV
jgi:plastocyanin